MCVTQDQAAMLPPAIWTCNGTTSSSIPMLEENLEKQDHHRVQSFRYPHLSIEHKLSSSVVDPGFCDPDSPLSLSGYMDVTGSQFDTEHDKHYFFWFFEAREAINPFEPRSSSKTSSSTPLIVWLTGGPGCSSTLALLTENGPCSVENPDEMMNNHEKQKQYKKSALHTVPNPYSWNTHAHILYLDQPAGVGFSYGTINDRNEEMIAEDAYYFLQAFLKTYPEYQQNPLFIVGESYGGHYAPAIGERVVQGNAQSLENTVRLNLHGVGVGNGLTDPGVQYDYYADMAYHNSHNIRTVNKATYESMKDAQKTCVSMINECNRSGKTTMDFKCQAANAYCNTKVTAPYYNTGLNPYDIRKECGDHPLCYDFSHVELFLNQEETREALHVNNKKQKDSSWETCNNKVHGKFQADFVRDYSSDVKVLLDNDVRVLIYAGDVDFICNYLGNRAWTLALDWQYANEFRAAGDVDWNNGSGLIRTSGPYTANGGSLLTFLQVYDAGHMVPTDQPEVALDLINQFLFEKF